MWTSDLTLMMMEGVRDTLLMTLMSTLFGYLIGLPWGIVLAVTDKPGIRPNVVVYKILDVIANIMRSIPFLILLILVMPITRAIVGKTTGSVATIVPLTLAAAPFIGRMIESSIKEVDHGVVEAAQSMGAGTFIAMRYGYYRYETLIMIVSVVLLVILVQIFQTLGMRLSAKLDKRK